MERDILALINKENHKFSKGQRMICRYISENYDKAAFMTAGKLGQTVGVSRATMTSPQSSRPLCYGAWV